MGKSVKGRRGKMPKAVRIISYIIAGIVIFVLIVLITFAVLTTIGKKSLYDNSQSEAPTLAGEADSASSSDIKWQEGWVRYNGKVYEYNDNILTFLIMGIDHNGKITTAKNGIDGGQADSLFLLVLNPDDKKINIVAINRNLMTDVDVYDKEGNFVDTRRLQICLQHGYGDAKEVSCERQENVVSKLMYNLPIHGYAAINMGAISKINDSVDGVTLEVLEDMTKADKSLVKGSTVTLKGKTAFTYVNWRDDGIFDSATMRLDRQKQYLSAFEKQLISKTKENITFPVTLFNTITPYMVTDIDVSQVSYLATQALGYSFDSDHIYSIDGTTKLADTGYEEFTYDEDSLKDLVVNVFYKEVSE